MEMYDLIVIGGGSGGIATANRAALHGAKVAVVEGQVIGGTCVNVGCVPKKIMWYGAQVGEAIDKYGPDYGYQVNHWSLQYSKLKKNRDAYIQRSRAAYLAGFERNQVELIQGWASFVDSQTIEVKGKHLQAKNFVIATGGQALWPEIEGAQLGKVSDDVFAWETLPKSVAVVGAGYIAVELAGVLHGLGVTTHLFFRKDRPLRTFDHKIVDQLLDTMRQDGIDLQAHKVPKSLTSLSNGSKRLTFEDGTAIIVDEVIWAIGRKAKLDGLKLDRIGVQVTADGKIAVNDHQETSVPGIYALGDCIQGPELTPVAIKTGRLLAERLFNGQKTLMDFSLVPTVIFSHPPIGTIGYSEEAAIAAFGPDQIKVYQSQFASMYTAVTSHRQVCLFRLITQGPQEKVIGLHGIGYGVDEMIQGFAVGMKMGATKADFDAVIAIHPTGAEEFVTMR